MSQHEASRQEELLYLEETLKVVRRELDKEEKERDEKLGSVIASGREMWEESVHFSDDTDRIPEMTHYLFETKNEAREYGSKLKRIERYRRMIQSPYFGRFDFVEEGYDEVEKIYVGSYNLIDPETDTILIYDWRAPISSIFYQYEPGKGAYKSPAGIVSGDISLKRQYKIINSDLKYFFDCSVRINDEILQEVLGRNSSPKMRSIVETIQKEQDIIIRDIENELLIVQGVAGSGKTSIALHRIAFLLYEGLKSKLNINNVIIISPNSIFNSYISSVLPELGEENVEQATFDEIVSRFLDKSFIVETRQKQLEELAACRDKTYFAGRVRSIEFKGSSTFVKILDRLLDYYEKTLIEFQDVYYDAEIIETRQQLKNLFLNNKIGLPAAKRLKRMENMILNKIHPKRKKRLEKIQRVVEKENNHSLEIRTFSRLMAIREAEKFMKQLKSFTEVNYLEIYKILFSNFGRLLRLSKGLELPDNIDDIANETQRRLKLGYISYEDCAPLLYLKLKLEGYEEFSEIRQVVIDEAQDYYPLHFEVFKLLFRGARYTVLGDFNQTMEKNGSSQQYEDIERILNKRKTVKLYLNKSYRASYEINAFTQRLLDYSRELISFERHEQAPVIIYKESRECMDRAVAEDISSYFGQGYGSVAVICKTERDAEELESRLKPFVSVKLLDDSIKIMKNCAVIAPSYLAKGLEFDVVLVYGASIDRYNSEFDRRLLYIACTRALHRLNIYYTGEKSPLI